MDKTNYRQTEYNKPFIIQRADPYVYRHSDGTYWFTASVPEYDRIVLRNHMEKARKRNYECAHLGTGNSLCG